MSIMIVIKLFVLFSFSLHKFDGKAFDPCVIGNVNKCLGQFLDNQYSIPNPDAKLLNVSQQPDSSTCFNMCADNEFCFMAAFRDLDQSCFMYENISYSNVIDHTYLLFFWRCCNTNTSYQAPNRCPGFWKTKSNYITYNSKRLNDPLLTITNANLYDCQLKCLQNPICGTVNIIGYKDSYRVDCELISQFSVENLSMDPLSNSGTFMWQCAYNYSLPKPPNSCSQRPDDFPGYWMVENQSIPMNNNLQSLLYFHTYNYKSCLENCKIYKHCKRAWYSLKSLFCVLESDGLASCADTQVTNDYNFTTYNWKYCPFDSLSPVVDDPLTQCHKIIDNRYMYIYYSKCGHLPTNKSLVYPCSVPINRDSPLLFSGNFNCQNNQSFRLVIESGKQRRVVESEFNGMKWIRVFTGYESFWLGNTSDINFPACNVKECEIYDASIKSVDSGSLEIISRKEWFSRKPKGPQRNYPNFPVPYVIITDTERPFCNCFTREACSYQIREIESLLVGFFSIPYNFIVTGDGVAYISRGWNYENAANNAEYNPKSMSIALLGRYENEPEVATLNTIKKIISLSIKEKKLAENYTLLLHRDVSRLNLPLEGLLRVIELWPHYRNHLKFNCPTPSMTIVFFNVFSILIIFTLILLLIHIFIRRLRHSGYCKTIRMCRIESIYGNIQKPSVEILPQIKLHHLNNFKSLNIFISPFTCSVYWIDEIHEFDYVPDKEKQCHCRSAIFSLFDLCRFQSKLICTNSLAVMPELKACSKIIAFIFERNSEPDNQKFFILHCTSYESFKRFITKLHNNQCLCNSYRLIKYVPNSDSFLKGHGCFEQPKNTETKSYYNRIDMENQYSFFRDGKNYLCFNKQ